MVPLQEFDDGSIDAHLILFFRESMSNAENNLLPHGNNLHAVQHIVSLIRAKSLEPTSRSTFLQALRQFRLYLIRLRITCSLLIAACAA
ncbi:hypothetical protein [Paenibacillus alvei]|uniref:hypothetical protein n=1 Tax=Paenibacillus alvei TaxID=44250 RepID=UPI0018CEECCA|nr:hypothetical protein [Paenibacillus alvei]MCY9582095.1 hypothetical protein [Paenibacillus alvei]